MCGVVGMVSRSAVNQQIYDALTVLQHRGQDAAGIVTCDGVTLFQRKANGLVSDVFQQQHMQRLVGNMGIGHVRYPTAGSSSSAEAQPMYVNSPYGITLAHNGNLTNSVQLKEDVYREDRRHVNTGSRLRGPAECLCARVAARGRAPSGTGSHLRGDSRRASALSRRVCRRSDDHRRRDRRVPRQIRNTSAGVRQTRNGNRDRLHDRFRKRCTRHPRVPAGQGRGAR